jgi:hypothetical protein
VWGGRDRSRRRRERGWGKRKGKRGNSRDQEQVCGIRNSDLWLWIVSEEPYLGSADSREKIGSNF